MHSLKVILADDHKIFRDGFKLVLESIGNIEPVAEAGDGKEFMNYYHALKPDLVFLDLNMPKKSGLEVLKEIRHRDKETKIIILTAIEDSNNINEIIDSGADGFLLKSADYKTIEKAVKNVLEGKSYFSEDILNAYIKNQKHSETPKSLPELTKREKEILQLVCTGASANKISELLNVSKRTIEKHKENIMLKTQTNSTSELIVYAFKEKLISF